jgi:pimeloyl-ACP methyl ester carboxylesterase
VEIPNVRYAKTADGTHIAFQVFGQGPRDLVYVPGFISNVLLNWELPGMAHTLERLARFARVVVMDHRGTGLSDRLPPGQLPPLETQMDDLAAVMDAVHIRSAHLFGDEDGAALCAVFAASYPERVQSFSAYALTPRLFRTEDYPFGRDEVTDALASRNAWRSGIARGGSKLRETTTSSRRRRSRRTRTR